MKINSSLCKMVTAKFIFSLIFFVSSMDLCFSSSLKSKVLSRQRRYIGFPEGSSFSCAGCVTVGVLGEPAPITTPGVITFGLNWGIAYELPNETQTTDAIKKYKIPNMAMAKRRNRRDLYQKLEKIMDNMGYNGRECILKTLCETTQRIMPQGTNMIEEIFRLLFTLPLTKVLSKEPPEHAIYDAAHRLGTLLQNCDKYSCPLSLVDLAQGYYDARAPNVPVSDLYAKPWTLFSNSFGK